MATKHEDVKVQLTGQDGNIFNVLGQVSRALNGAGYAEDADEMAKRVFEAESYNQALSICMEYVVVS